jgi:hypothetical protein
MIVPYAITPNPVRFSWCGTDNVECLAHASLIWQDIQDAAEAHYDRSSHARSPRSSRTNGRRRRTAANLHRNIIFRNAVVPALPTSYMETQTPEGLRAAIRNDCIDGLPAATSSPSRTTRTPASGSCSRR